MNEEFTEEFFQELHECAAETFAVFDSLPPDVRKALREADDDIDPIILRSEMRRGRSLKEALKLLGADVT